MKQIAQISGFSNFEFEISRISSNNIIDIGDLVKRA